MEDAQIIELFFVRSEDAISELDKKYGKLCHKLADNILASAQDAEECVNDAYLSTWNAIPPQRPESLPAFVGTLVRCCSITRYRANTAMKRNSHYDMCMEELETFLASPQQAVEEHYAARELAAAIELWGDRIFEKCGIGRDERGDGGKTLEIRGKRRLSARDGGANYQQS